MNIRVPKLVAASALLVVATVGEVAQGALPANPSDPLAADTLRRARAALKGHAADPKVALLPEAPTGTKASDTAYVLPLQARARLALSKLATPRCDLLQTATNNVNGAITSLAVLAQSVLTQANRVSQLLDDHAAFVLAHQNELVLAEEGYTKIVIAEAIVATLQASLAMETEPELIALYVSELALAQAQLDAAKSDRKYSAALAVKAQAEAIMDLALQEQEAWSALYTQRLAGALSALEVARAAYDDLASIEVAGASARLPVWDADVLALLKAGSRGGIRFVPARLEDVAWSVQDADMPRMAPIEIELWSDSQAKLNGSSRMETLPGLSERPSVKRMQSLSNADFTNGATSFGEGVLGRSWSRETRSLSVDAPLVRASVPLGAYCGSLSTVTTTEGSVAGPRSRASLRVQRYQMVTRKRAAVESYLGVADYRVKAQGPASTLTCAVDLAQYAKLSGGKPVDVTWLWNRYSAWDPLVVQRLRRLGVRCSSAELERLRSAGMNGVLRDATAWAASDASVLLTRLNTALSTGSRPNFELSAINIAPSDMRRAGQVEICKTGKCVLPGLLPNAAELACRALGALGKCQGARLAGQVNWAPLYWQGSSVRAQLDLEIPRL